jgi:hypothetical protein
MSVIFLFIDGVGLGEQDSDNPLFNNGLDTFSFMSGGQPFTQNAPPVIKKNHLFKPIDAALGVEGLPQSGTGQAALFSGENAPRIVGRHFGPFPHSATKPLLQERSLFRKTQEQGKSCTFVNAYPNIFFRKAKARSRWTCTTLMTKGANIPLNGEQDIKDETALTADITQESWRENLQLDVPVITPEQAAKRLIGQSLKYDLLLHEYYLTDKAGHSREKEQALTALERYGQFLWALIQFKPERITLVLSSDHGNIEDLSTKSHTLNKVPLFVYGQGAPLFHQAESIMDVTPGILKTL